MISRARQRWNGLTIAGAVATIVFLLVATVDGAAAWTAEPGVETPTYAVTEPASTNLNIDSVVLMCEAAGAARVLQLKLYLTDDGPLRPDGMAIERLKGDPRVEISVDGRVFPVSILFADEYAVLADGERDRTPMLSDDLLDAVASGKRMLIRFDLATEPAGQAAAFDGEAVIDLGAAAITAVRRCASPLAAPSGSMAFASH